MTKILLDKHAIIRYHIFSWLYIEYLTNIKHFPCLYQHEWKLGKREIVWKYDARRAECFHTISSFPNSTSVDIYNFISIRKKVLYLFYNMAQRNIKKEIFRRFRVDIELYQHGSWPISVQNLQKLYYKKYSRFSVFSAVACSSDFPRL
jgi:hypothetical protein